MKNVDVQASSVSVVLCQWSTARMRAVRIDASFRSSLSGRTKSVIVELPVEFLEVVKAVLRERSIPMSHLSRGLGDALLDTQVTDDCPIWTEYVYRTRDAAHRAATRLFARDRSQRSVVMRYRDGGRTAAAMFTNPLPYRGA